MFGPMRNGTLLPVLALSLLTCGETQAYNMRITGVVTEYLSGSLVTNALVRVYKDGVKVQAEETGAFGKYAFTLDNNAKYVIRFGAPDHQTKCYSIDTHGLEWEGENKTKDLWVEMTLFEKIADLDLSFFDLPMGMARFEPATGLVSWDTDYDKRIREEVQGIMSEYERRMTAIADASSSKGHGVARRTHSGATR